VYQSPLRCVRQQQLEAGPPEAAQLVAAECVVEAETKDHLNWELLGQFAGRPRVPLARLSGQR
jgi:hypothetical protein